VNLLFYFFFNLEKESYTLTVNSWLLHFLLSEVILSPSRLLWDLEVVRGRTEEGVELPWGVCPFDLLLEFGMGGVSGRRCSS
jgi:hypothetical protein